MHKLSDMIHIDKRFQNSINLHLDLENDEKIKCYIPTRSSVVVLKKYLSHITENKEKANILIGPYGKGKSHLLLVLLALITREDKLVKYITKKIREVDEETTVLVGEVSGKKFLPVIVSGTYGDLNKAFIAGLREGLQRAGLEDIVPKSYFSEATKAITNWKNHYQDTYRRFQKELEKEQLDITEMLSGLERGVEKYIRLFESIYPKLTSGSKFTPFVETEAVKLYRELNEVLGTTKGYDGIYIVFDEFSKYIEGHEPETFARDMKILQDMCELSASTKKYQIHITFVAHKSIKEYGNAIPKEMLNAFTGVEGRLKEERFIVSSGNNYELIKHVVEKNKKDYKQFLQENPFYRELINASYKVACFEGNFSKADYEKIVTFGGFPLLPLTAYCLLNISEKVAQNERSIFTFLANDEQGSLVQLIENSNEMFGADVIYDYFENLFREERSMVDIHNEWLQADFALTKAETEEEKKIIKTIAILRMIRKQDELPVIKEKIWLASGVKKDLFDRALTKLEKKEFVKFRSKLGVYAFKHNVGLDIEEEITQIINVQSTNINLEEKIGQVSELDFILPKQYNQKYTMTRFFRYVFMSPYRFQSIEKSEYLFEEYNADGLIICVVKDKNSRLEDIQDQLASLDDKRIVVLYPKTNFSQTQTIRKLIAVRKMLTDKEFTEDNKVLVRELKIYEEDLVFEINSFLEKNYMPENKECDVLYGSEKLHFQEGKNFNRFLSGICESYYDKAPKINNELINRKNISTQIKKARRKIVENILDGKDYSVYDQGTSPEATIFRATMVHTGMTGKVQNQQTDEGLIKINYEIDNFITNCSGRKVAFSKLYSVLEGKGFGVRKGIIPIFLAKKISAMLATPVIYLNNKEVEITSEVFDNINEKPNEYYLYVEKESVIKEKYLNQLENIFGLSEVEKKNQRNRLSSIVQSMQKWYRNLSQYTLNTKRGDKEKSFYEFRNLFQKIELNPRDILFEKIPTVLCDDTENINKKYDVCICKIREIVDYFNSFLEKEKRDTALQLKQIFGATEKESLSACLRGWYRSQGKKAKTYIGNDCAKNFMNCIENLSINDEMEITSMVSKTVYGIYIEDWNDDSKKQFIEEIKNIKNQMEVMKDDNENDVSGKFSFIDSDGNEVEKYYDADVDDSTSYFLQNAIEDALDEFGDTLETNQKLSVLVQTIENLLKR